MQKVLLGSMHKVSSQPLAFPSKVLKRAVCLLLITHLYTGTVAVNRRGEIYLSIPGSVKPALGVHVYGSASTPGLHQAARVSSPENAG